MFTGFGAGEAKLGSQHIEGRVCFEIVEQHEELGFGGWQLAFSPGSRPALAGGSGRRGAVDSLGGRV